MRSCLGLATNNAYAVSLYLAQIQDNCVKKKTWLVVLTTLHLFIILESNGASSTDGSAVCKMKIKKSKYSFNMSK
jgi:hypothetical protein